MVARPAYRSFCPCRAGNTFRNAALVFKTTACMAAGVGVQGAAARLQAETRSCVAPAHPYYAVNTHALSMMVERFMHDVEVRVRGGTRPRGMRWRKQAFTCMQTASRAFVQKHPQARSFTAAAHALFCGGRQVAGVNKAFWRVASGSMRAAPA